MRTGNLKKYIVPNIPYLFIGWAFLKLGTAYRMAAGADLLSKVMGIGQTIGVAFADFAPGLNPIHSAIITFFNMFMFCLSTIEPKMIIGFWRHLIH